MGNKRVYFFTIISIAIYAIVFKFVYPELEITALTTVIAILGYLSALFINYLLLKYKKGENDE